MLLDGNFKYLYVYVTNVKFNKDYGSMFEDGVCYDQTLYKIHDSDNGFLLVPVE